MFSLTTHQFLDSCYYPASGGCVQPMLRLSHLAKRFTAAEFQLDVDEYVDNLRHSVAVFGGSAAGAFHEEHSERLALPRLEILELNTYDDLGFGDFPLQMGSVAAHRAVDELMTTRERSEYHRAFAAPIRGRGQVKQWGVVARLRRCIEQVDGPPLVREFELTVWGGEALISLFGFGGPRPRVPRIVCSVQSGQLEGRGGFLDRLFERPDADLPELWVQGVETGKHGEPRHAPQLATGAKFGPAAQSFQDWSSVTSFVGGGHMRRVHAFSPAGVVPERSPVALSACGQVEWRQMREDDFESFDLVVAPQFVADALGLKEHAALLTHEDVLPIVKTRTHDAPWIRPSAAVGLRALEQHARFRRAKDVLLLPFGYEDEGQILAPWLDGVTGLKSITVLAPNVLDYSDLCS